MALYCLLAFWIRGDAQQMDRLFPESGLMREKWDAVHYADGATYGERTVERALALKIERFDLSMGRAGHDEESDAGGSEPAPGSGRAPSRAETTDNGRRSTAHLVERNQLLRQRIDEQAARIEA